MKTLAIVGFLSVFGFVGCAAEEKNEIDVAEGELSAQLGAEGVMTCAADGTGAKLALLAAKDGKTSLVSLSPAGKLYTVSRTTGTLESSTSKWSWKATGSSLAFGSNMKGTWEHGSESTSITCAKAPAAETASWRAASALVDYAGEIEGLGDTIVEEMASFSNENGNGNAKPETKSMAYTVFAVETAKRGELALGDKVANSTGALPGEAGEEALDEDDFSYGPMSAAYALGGGDDYGEWFQGASDGISLSGALSPALGTARAGFIAHEKVSAFGDKVDSAKPSAVEITVGAWTFLLPDAFAK